MTDRRRSKIKVVFCLLFVVLLMMLPLYAFAETKITSLPIHFDKQELAKKVVVGTEIPDDTSFYDDKDYEKRYPSVGILADLLPNAYISIEGWWIEDPDCSEKQAGQGDPSMDGWTNTHNNDYGTGKFVNGHRYAIAFRISAKDGYELDMNTVQFEGVAPEDIILRIDQGPMGGIVVINLGTVEDIQENAKKDPVPKTGDTTPVVPLALMTMMSAVSMALILRKRFN